MINIAESESRFREVFTNRHVVLPVIHVASTEQAQRNANIAMEAGADGVFLINHSINSEALLEIHSKIADLFPNWWVGVNCLDLAPEAVFARISPLVAGVWVDNAMIDEENREQPDAEVIQESQSQHGWNGLYFGGVAFKYQRRVSDLSCGLFRRFPRLNGAVHKVNLIMMVSFGHGVMWTRAIFSGPCRLPLA